MSGCMKFGVIYRNHTYKVSMILSLHAVIFRKAKVCVMSGCMKFGVIYCNHTYKVSMILSLHAVIFRKAKVCVIEVMLDKFHLVRITNIQILICNLCWSLYTHVRI